VTQIENDRHLSQPTPIRFPEELKAWLKHKAIDSRRSLSNEVVYRIEQGRRAEEATQNAS